MRAALALCILPLAAEPSGEEIYKNRCSGCHEQASPRIPHRDSLRKMTSARILRSLDFGAMMTIAYTMNRAERQAVSQYLGQPGGNDAPRAEAYCKDRRAPLPARPRHSWNGWSPASDNARYQPDGGIGVADVSKLELKWAFVFDGDVNSFAQPSVIGNTLFTGSVSGAVYALHARTGCVHWYFQANGPVRTAIRIVDGAALFADQTGWVYSVDAATGTLRWKRRIEDHDATRLTGAPAVWKGVAYFPVASWEETRALSSAYPCCTFRGSVAAVRIADGGDVWKTYFVDEPKPTGITRAGTQRLGPSGAGVWSTPTLDEKRGLLYVTTGDNYSAPNTGTSDAVIALRLRDGKIEWVRQTFRGDVYNSACGPGLPNCPEEKGPDYDFGSSTILAGDLLLAGQKSGMVYALDPAAGGRIVWERRVGKGSLVGGVQWGMASDGKQVYAAVADTGMTRNTGARPDDLRRFLLDPKTGGGITALRIRDGEARWHKPGTPCEPPRAGCSPAQSAAVTAIPGVVFSGSMDGHMRAYASEDGKLLWDFDTVREFQGVNGPTGHGGSIDGPGAVVVNGMVYITSGYARFGGMSGNVLLAFAPR
ncbi:MAG: cytochrome C oxidase Cbb3 [Acidobacteria bacterium]|nr:cytochrome C oxidase Cbb3 [Acidobacteriota bacterium]